MKLVYYSLLMSNDSHDKLRVSQLMTSIQSLRNNNSSIRVHLHLFGKLPKLALDKLKSLNIYIFNFHDYADLIEHHLLGTGEWLGHYPVMHKFLTMKVLQQFEPTQVLYLDSDTYIHLDIEQLFEEYSDAHIYAREEPGSRQSPLGYHPEYLDEDNLYKLETELGCNIVKPFNTGVLLMNNDIWQQLLDLSSEYLAFVARFSLWMEDKKRGNDTPADVAYLAQNKTNLAEAITDLSPLPFPSSNFWIKEQVALWLTVGKIKDVNTDFFKLDHVLQGGEELRAPGQLVMPVVSHYYSQNTMPFIEAVSSARLRTLYQT